MSQVDYCLFETSLGWCAIAWCDGEGSKGPAVAYFQLPDATAKLTEARMIKKSGASKAAKKPPARIAEIIRRVSKHFDGEPQQFDDIEVDLGKAGPFARRVYEAARKIPAGQTMSYGDIARVLDQPKAARAVGQALGKNPIALIVPCHRILAAGGKIGGFSTFGGRDTKTRMLAIEGATIGLPKTIKSAKDLPRLAAHLATQDPHLARCLSHPLEMNLKPKHSPYASLFEAIAHQQLSPKAASTILGRVKALYPDSTIPEPSALLETSDETLRAAGLSGSKTAAIKDLAAKALDGTVPSAEEIVALGDEEIIQRLTSIRGIGRWTVEMLLIFNLGRADVFPVDDYALKKIIAHVYDLVEVPSAKELLALAEAWRPLRSVASLYLWNYIKLKDLESIEAIAPEPKSGPAKARKAVSK
ncbi:methylated-DNA--[protein]-cysteine S-methyltransferase [Singulisphaera sp. PoT]|uniref:methylated-DNA--[protein]-cysteine S-methyltransferase n=1 Tax=Singulisphaera sp. PoT TaxID=3411797 RepID=UPI003BF55871